MDNEVNVKGASLRDLFRVYTESSVSEQNQTQSPIDKAFASILMRLDKKGKSLIDGGTQVKKKKSKKLLDKNLEVNGPSAEQIGKVLSDAKSKSQNAKSSGKEIR